MGLAWSGRDEVSRQLSVCHVTGVGDSPQAEQMSAIGNKQTQGRGRDSSELTSSLWIYTLPGVGGHNWTNNNNNNNNNNNKEGMTLLKPDSVMALTSLRFLKAKQKPNKSEYNMY